MTEPVKRSALLVLPSQASAAAIDPRPRRQRCTVISRVRIDGPTLVAPGNRHAAIADIPTARQGRDGHGVVVPEFHIVSD